MFRSPGRSGMLEMSIRRVLLRLFVACMMEVCAFSGAVVLDGVVWGGGGSGVVRVFPGGGGGHCVGPR